ncbi:MAG: MoxR family ATPase [Proteobacteria bacterium]|nr:MoxR family ATPase [Pseudomonadota bacterium]
MTESPSFILPKECRPPSGRHPNAPKKPEPYVAANALVTAVNLAIYLRRPLLLEGEAGCGKSRLARHVAYELGLPLYEWPVRSTSLAQDGLYTYDSILRLHDVHLKQADKPGLFSGKSVQLGRTATGRHPENPMDYVNFGALGKAFRLDACPAVVLIDEIDKADIDFPNDLLTVLEEPWKFEIKEADDDTPPIVAKHPPIVIITSNKEKGNLPEPFLRRCVYFYIEFPSDKDRLKLIINAHYTIKKSGGELAPPAAALMDAACERFLAVRNKGDLYKKPGTSEFLDWLEAMRGFRDLPGLIETLHSDEAKLPYPELLFKIHDDWWRYAAKP